MEPELKNDQSDKGIMTMWLIWASIVGSLFIYIFMAHQLGDGIRKNINPDMPLPLLRNILLLGVTPFEIIVIFILKKRLMPKRELPDSMDVIAPLPAIPLKIVSQYTTAMLICMAIAESIGIYGLVLYFLGATTDTLYLFIGISAVVMFFLRPNREILVEMAVEAEKAEHQQKAESNPTGETL